MLRLVFIIGKKAVVEITGISERGFGIAKLGDGRIVEIPGALPNEVVTIRLGRKKLGYILKFIEKNNKRVMPICCYAQRCGGCLWQDVDYSEQLRLKQLILEKLLSRLNANFELKKIIPSPQIYGYRGKTEFIFAEGSTGLALGFRELGYFDKVIDIFACWLQPVEANIVLSEMKAKLAALNYPPYNIYTRQGFLRYLVLRTSFYNREVLANIITASGRKENLKLNLEYLSTETGASSIIWSINDTPADVATGNIEQVYGKGYLEEECEGFKFKVCPYCFYQSNPIQAKTLFSMAKKLGEEGETALDLYSGIGTISIIVSENFDKVIGIELEKCSVETAKENAKINDVSNVEFHTGKVEDMLDKISSSLNRVNTVFIDPPRSGMHYDARRALVRIKPERIVYISCNPRTQVEDISYLMKFGYKLILLQPIDMLPHTPHIETLALLEKE
ncbi:MAG: 23S rRNA (uracil(1939)-C(5))-methyltransferase RlmD [Candidatus Korarchaeota archaeon]